MICLGEDKISEIDPGFLFYRHGCTILEAGKKPHLNNAAFFYLLIFSHKADDPA